MSVLGTFSCHNTWISTRGRLGVPPYLAWGQPPEQAEVPSKLPGATGHHSLLFGACFSSLRYRRDHRAQAQHEKQVLELFTTMC